MASLMTAAAGLFAVSSCGMQEKEAPAPRLWVWAEGSLEMSSRDWEDCFALAEKAGADALILQVHGGYPEVPETDTCLQDREALEILRRAVPYARRSGIELHAWIWTLNRCERNLRRMHPDWYQVSAEGKSCLDVKLYGREHYRWLCPSRPEVTEYLRKRVAELAAVEGVAGVHLDFIRYPDAILPYGLHESRGVVQDRVYPQWDHCYCEVCRSLFRGQTGRDPMSLTDPTEDEAWMRFRWDAVSRVANALADEIHRYGKQATAAVFASPEESRRLVRQDWSTFSRLDRVFPMIYHRFYDWEDEKVRAATREGTEELAGKGVALTSGLFAGHCPSGRLDEFFRYVLEGGSDGVCIFSLSGIAAQGPDYADSLRACKLRYFKR